MEIGDVVQLKSGGPLMTVVDVSKAQPDPLAVFMEPTEFFGSIECCWFTMNGELQRGNFPVDVLATLHYEQDQWVRRV